MNTENDVKVSATSIILVRPQLADNIGSTARVMANFDLSDLRIVDPHCEWPCEKGIAVAKNAYDIAIRAKVFSDIPSAVVDTTRVYAFSARKTTLLKKKMFLSTFVDHALACSGRIALIFGPESSGLTSADLKYADVFVTIPSSSNYKSLNLSHSVCIACYQLFVARNFRKTFVTQESSMASVSDILYLTKSMENIFIKKTIRNFRDEIAIKRIISGIIDTLRRAEVTSLEVRRIHRLIKYCQDDN